jgi:Protein of unknown function (DUF2889)
MPLSKPAERERIHTRRVTCQGYLRADGLWDIEAHLSDTKTYAFDNDHRGTVEPGDPVHDMWMRLTVDDKFTVVAVEASTDRSPFSICGQITPAYQKLVGLSIGAGWNKRVKELLGGVHGCTHLVELLGPMATTAFQTIFPMRSKLAKERGEATAEPKPARPPRLLNTCYGFKSDGEVVQKEWPEWYTGAKLEPASGS